MTPARGPVRWLGRLGLGRPMPDESVEWEIEHHLSELTDRLSSEGWDPAEARREAERRFGDAGRYGPWMRRLEKGRVTMEWGRMWSDLIRQSISSVVRTARRYPGYTVGVVATLSLGIGANSTMYGIIDRLLLQPPAHIERPEQVRRVFGQRPNPLTREMSIGSTITHPDYADLEAHTGLAAVAAYTGATERTIGRGEGAARARVALATADFFPLLGVTPTVGRFYAAEEDAPGSSLTAVIGHEHWRSAYGADPEVLGRSLEVGGRVHTVVGVAPKGFTGLDLGRVDVWLPLAAAHRESEECVLSRGCWWLSAVVRLAEGTSVEAAEAEATRLHLAARREMIEEGRYSDRASIVLGSVIAARGPEASDDSRVATWLWGVSAIVLLIACANVANLLMARGTRQRREIGVRLALGAARTRVVAQMMLEAILLAVAGGAVALVLARWGGQVVRSTLLPGVYFPSSALGIRVLGFTLAAAVLAGLCAGLAPAVQGGREAIGSSVGGGSRGSSAGRSRLRGFLTVAQAAMSVVLLVGAGLFVRSLSELRAVDLGLDVDRLLVARLEFEADPVEPVRQNELYEEAMRHVTRLASVRSAAATGIPFMWGWSTGLRVPGLDSIPRLPAGGPYAYPVSSGYFETVGVSVVRGRPIDDSDRSDGTRVVVVSETMARLLWPEAGALGQCLMVGTDAEGCTTVVGVAEDAARGGFQDGEFMAYYLPSTQVDPADEPHRALYVRTDGDAEAATEDVAMLLRAYSPEVRYANVQTFAEMLDPQARAWTLGATMFSVFGLLALVLAAIGLFSVLAFDVAQRTRELGIRTALGAEKARLLTSVLYRGARFGVLGVGLGLAAAYMAAPYARELLFGVSPRDPIVLTGVALMLLTVSGVASLVPGLRATRVDPVAALKSE